MWVANSVTSEISCAARKICKDPLLGISGQQNTQFPNQYGFITITWNYNNNKNVAYLLPIVGFTDFFLR